MVFSHSFYLICIALISYFVSAVHQERILGCNGFIKSDHAIDFSKIEVKLISKEGNLKDKIECAPNNGYFFLPIYDKGEYTLQISGVYKWVFEPEEVKINFDGINDVCSKSQDVIFTFKGFRVFGKVSAVGDRKAPKGIAVTLVADLPTEQKEVGSVLTDEEGSFDISPVLPGSYIIKASHPRWRISKSLVTFSIDKGNHEVASQSLLFAGYDVTGSVVSSGEPIGGVHFVLFATSDSPIEASWISGCYVSPLDGFDASDLKLTNAKRLCYVTSDEKGSFSFMSVPSGSYAIAPFYKGANSLKFDVHPRVVRFTVSHDSYGFSKPFLVSGFNVIGHVLSKPVNGRPIPKVKVVLDKEKTVETNADGSFLFEGIKSGLHHIQVKGDDFQFNDIEVKIMPTSAILENVYPTAFKVCGNVKKLQPVEIIVTFDDANGVERKVQANNKGYYCSFLTAGNYTVNVSPTESQPEKVLWFFPINHQLEVTDKPLNEINFRQETAQLTGTVECVDDKVCSEISVLLRGLGSLEEEYNEVTKGGKYKFVDLYPGHYELSVSNNANWCWQSSTHKIFISQVQNKAPIFKQTGISFMVSSSHDTKLKYKKVSSSGTASMEGILDIRQGVQQYCLPGDAIYHLETVGCHRYAESAIRWEVGQDSLMLEALSHEIKAVIVSSEQVDDISVDIYNSLNGTVKARIGPLKGIVDKKYGADFVYKFQFQAAADEKLIIRPESSLVLFTPSNLTVYGTNDCMELDEQIVAKRGIRLEGSVQPPLQKVKMSILNELDEVVVSMFTDAAGKYKFMPLHSDHNYRIIGEKEGYVLSGPFENGTFKVHKLAEIQVTLEDENKKALQGVLLSLSGGENYRQTSQSNVAGKITFLSLKPSEYYLRPMLKEYKFLPPSKVVTIKEGETVPVNFTGHRVLYSVFGSVFSLNRFPEKDIVVEAVSKAEGECDLHQEEGSTDEYGQFRIRGLQPRCVYDIRLKLGSGSNKMMYKSLPERIHVKMSTTDVEDVSLIVIPETTQCDVSVLLEFSLAEHLHSVQLKLLDDDGGVVHTIKFSDWKTSRYALKTVLLPLPTLPMNGKSYCVQLESSLSKSTYVYTPQTVYFTANATFLPIRISFMPQLKLSDSDVKHSYTSAVFILVLALIYWRKDVIVMAVSNLQNNSGFSFSELLRRYSQPPKGRDTEKTFIEFEPGMTVVKRKLKPRKM